MDRRSKLEGLAGVVGVGAGILAVVVIAALVPSCSSFELSAPARHHLRPVKIAPEACGAVEAIHAQLDALEQDYFAAQLGIDGNTLRAVLRSRREPPAARRIPWVLVRTELDATAQRLDAAIASGTPAFPARVRHYLTLLRTDLAEGRMALAGVDRSVQLEAATRDAFDRGQKRAGYASDLIGHQCPVRLGADNF